MNNPKQANLNKELAYYEALEQRLGLTKTDKELINEFKKRQRINNMQQ